jgi:hypothetical protein
MPAKLINAHCLTVRDETALGGNVFNAPDFYGV